MIFIIIQTHANYYLEGQNHNSNCFDVTSFFTERELKGISKEPTKNKIMNGKMMTQKMLNKIKEAIVNQFEMILKVQQSREKGNHLVYYIDVSYIF